MYKLCCFFLIDKINLRIKKNWKFKKLIFLDYVHRGFY